MFTYSSEARMWELVTKANKFLTKLHLGEVTILSITPRKVQISENAFQESIYGVVFDAEIAFPEITFARARAVAVEARVLARIDPGVRSALQKWTTRSSWCVLDPVPGCGRRRRPPASQAWPWKSCRRASRRASRIT